MAKEYFRQTDQFPTITVLISAPVEFAGQTWRGTVPLSGVTFDGRATQPALISSVISAAFGGANGEADVACRLLSNTAAADYSPAFDARKTALGSIAFELQFSEEFAGMADVPLTFTVAGLGTDAPALNDITLPTLPTNTTDLTIKDLQGGSLPSGTHSKQVAEDGLILGETAVTAYRGDRGKEAYDHSQLTSGNPHDVTKTQVGLGNVTNDVQLKASQLDTDGTFAANSDELVPSQKAVKAYVDANAGGGGGGGDAPEYFPPRQAAYGRKAMLGTWTKATGFTGEAFTRMMWIPEWACFIGISEKIWRSYDGKTFTQIATASGLNPQAAVWVPEIRRIISTGNSSNALYWCDINDPTNWSTVPSGGVLPSENFNSLYYNSHTKILLGRGGARIYHSTDHGESWVAGGTGAHWGSDNVAYLNGGSEIYIYDGSAEVLKLSTDLGVSWVNASPSAGSITSLSGDESAGIFAYITYPSNQVAVRNNLNSQIYVSAPGTQGILRYFPDLNLWTVIENGQTPKFSVDLRTWETAGNINTRSFPSAWSEPLGIVVNSGRADNLQYSIYVKGE